MNDASSTVSDTGEVALTLVVDHRIHDATTAGRCLQQIEQTLNGTIADELSTMLASHHQYQLFPLPDAERDRRAA